MIMMDVFEVGCDDVDESWLFTCRGQFKSIALIREEQVDFESPRHRGISKKVFWMEENRQFERLSQAYGT